jgi:hypothetical protein
MRRCGSQDARTTATIASDATLVPWLSADGPLAYRPEAPPASDYFFQYGWILPGIFADHTNRRRHFYFGATRRDEATALFAFWARCRAAPRGAIRPVAASSGGLAPETVTAPVAVYEARGRLGTGHYLFIQHGSYQLVPPDDQPCLHEGEVLLYRGLMQARRFRMPAFDRKNPGRYAIWRRYVELQAHVLSDSVRSFNAIHDRAQRCETEHIRDRSFLTDHLAEEHGLRIHEPGPAAELWRATRQSFSLCRWVAANKFGPHYVVLRTSLDNIRITTFFAREHEARILDPDRMTMVEVHGCRIHDRR